MRIILAIFILAIAGCKAMPEYLNTNKLVTNYQRVGVLSFSTESSLNYFQPQLADFYQTKVENGLRDIGFEVVNADIVRDIQTELEKNSQGLFNASTGQKNSELSDQLFSQALQKAKAQLGVDAFVFIGVDKVRAYFSNNIFSGYTAKWYGQEENYLSEDVDAGDVLGSLFVQKGGYLPGARLYMRFRDENNKLLSIAGGGIELLARFDDDGVTQSKTADKLFDDEAQLIMALQFAFEDLSSHKQKKR